MQNYVHLPTEVTPLLPYSTQFSASELEDEQNAHIQASVEDYLDRVCQPLIETVPYARRTELRCEISQHLYALVQAYQEMGDSSVAATEKALAKFGQPEKVARQWQPLLASKHRRISLRRWFGKQWQGIASTLATCSVMGLWLVVSRPIILSAREVNSQQMIAQQTRAQQQRTQVTSAPNNFSHRNLMNVECRSCHNSTVKGVYDLYSHPINIVPNGAWR